MALALLISCGMEQMKPHSSNRLDAGRTRRHPPRASRVFHATASTSAATVAGRWRRPAPERGLDPQAVLRRGHGREPGPDGRTRWDQRPLGDLVDFIVGHYHARLRTELPELLAMAQRVEARPRREGELPARPRRAPRARARRPCSTTSQKEEQILFPMLVRAGRAGRRRPDPGDGARARRPRRQPAPHARADDDLTPPEEACNTWRALYLRPGRARGRADGAHPPREQRAVPAGALRLTPAGGATRSAAPRPGRARRPGGPDRSRPSRRSRTRRRGRRAPPRAAAPQASPGATSESSRPSSQASSHAERPAGQREHRRLEQELPQHLALRRAPTARRRPISRVRSVTAMIITLAMPMPPMPRLTAASATVTSPISAETGRTGR